MSKAENIVKAYFAGSVEIAGVSLVSFSADILIVKEGVELGGGLGKKY